PPSAPEARVFFPAVASMTSSPRSGTPFRLPERKPRRRRDGPSCTRTDRPDDQLRRKRVIEVFMPNQEPQMTGHATGQCCGGCAAGAPHRVEGFPTSTPLALGQRGAEEGRVAEPGAAPDPGGIPSY